MKFLPLLFVLCGCAALKPLPAQTLDCAKSEGNASTAVKAAQCLAEGTTPAAELCWESLGEGLGLDVLQCAAIALWQDLHHAAQVGNAVGMPAATVQDNAQAYLVAKGVIVRTPTNP